MAVDDKTKVNPPRPGARPAGPAQPAAPVGHDTIVNPPRPGARAPGSRPAPTREMPPVMAPQQVPPTAPRPIPQTAPAPIPHTAPQPIPQTARQPVPLTQKKDAPAAPPPRQAAPAAQSVRDFDLERSIGAGGMASVYLARHRPSGRAAAVKILHAHLAHDQEFVKRFLLEVKATSSLRHGHVVSILDCGEMGGGSWFLATEYMDGGSVKDLLGRAGKCPPPIAVALAAQLLKGLGYAHTMGVIHRDIKPANLMLNRDGSLKIADFGIARTQGTTGLTVTGQLIGTPAYMSPEQASGKAVDGRTDLFSAGIVLYELLTGFNPYTGDNETTTLMNILQSEPRILFEVDPTVPAALERTLGRLLERDLARRYASAEEAIADLALFLPGVAQNPKAAVASFLVDPPRTAEILNQKSAEEHWKKAQAALAGGAPQKNAAILELYRTILLAPRHTEAQGALRRVLGGRDPFGASQNPKILELEAALQKSPQSHGVLMQLAGLYKLEGNLLKAVSCYKRVLRLRPSDAYTAGQLKLLLGDDAYEAEAVKAAITGQVTGGARVAAAAEPVTGARGPAQVARATGSQPLPGAPELPPPPSGKEQLLYFLKAHKGKLGAALAIALILWVTIRGLGSFIESGQKSVDESIASMDKVQTPMMAKFQAEVNDINRQAARRAEDSALAARTAMNEVRRLTNESKWDEAEKALQNIRTEWPRSREAAEVDYELGRLYSAQQRWFNAIAAYNDFISSGAVGERVPEALFYRGQANLADARYEDAIVDFRRLHDDHPSSALVTRGLYHEGEAHEKKGDLETAKARYEAVMSRTGPADRLHIDAKMALARVSGG